MDEKKRFIIKYQTWQWAEEKVCFYFDKTHFQIKLILPWGRFDEDQLTKLCFAVMDCDRLWSKAAA